MNKVPMSPVESKGDLKSMKSVSGRFSSKRSQRKQPPPEEKHIKLYNKVMADAEKIQIADVIMKRLKDDSIPTSIKAAPLPVATVPFLITKSIVTIIVHHRLKVRVGGIFEALTQAD